MTHEDLMEWMTKYPWLLVLDGLDEVPSSSNRGDTTEAIDVFLAEARQVDADLFVVASSRAEGYDQEFITPLTATRYVLPLSKVRALRYVERYAAARFGKGDPKGDDVVRSLRASANDELSCELMSSPLQVTFMVTVVAAQGVPGENRWRLLHSYYNTIYDRETQKEVDHYKRVLADHRQLVDRLHHDIGFWLQYKGESESGVSLPSSDFACIVDRYLREEGHEDPEVRQLTQIIVAAASERLVFLTSRIKGELTFEVRSLQEYAAAECLMTGHGSDPEIVKKRLSAIAAAPYWRNVFLFATAKCFADTNARHHQDTIRIICQDLNDSENPVFQAVRAGSDLAIDVLRSRSVGQNPKQERQLAQLAFQLMREPDIQLGKVPLRLAAICFGKSEEICRAELGDRLGQSDTNKKLGAWQVLLRLQERQWASELFKRFWPSEGTQKLAIANSVAVWPDCLREELSSTFWQCEPAKVLWSEAWFHSKVQQMSTPISVAVPVRATTAHLALAYRPVFSNKKDVIDGYSQLVNTTEYHPEWHILKRAVDFVHQPSTQLLATILEEAAERAYPNQSLTSILPWPMSNCLAMSSSPEDLLRIAADLRLGRFGEASDWKATEESLTSNKISFDQFTTRIHALESGDWDGGMEILNTASLISFDTQFTHNELIAISGALVATRSRLWKLELFEILSSALENEGGASRVFTAKQFEDLWSQVGIWPHCVDVPVTSAISGWINLWRRIGTEVQLPPYGQKGEWDPDWSPVLQDAFLSECDGGLLRILSHYAASAIVIDRIPPDRLQVHHFEDKTYQFAAILIRLSQASLSESEACQLAEECLRLLDPEVEEYAEERLWTTAAEHILRVPAIAAFLLHLLKTSDADDLRAARCNTILRRLASKHPSDFRNESDLRKLHLPVLVEQG
ncbi:MAG: hypothetical protein JST93_36430 [Acidobacteria bacterium]|nr:hypothetical protein [Acidobacteriota bacterium]